VNKPAYAAIKNIEQAMLEGFTDKPPAQATMACIQWFNGLVGKSSETRTLVISEKS